MQLRQYVASSGVGVGRDWGSASGAYIFRTVVPSLFGPAVLFWAAVLVGVWGAWALRAALRALMGAQLPR